MILKIVGFCLIGLVAGTASGMLGIGGAILAIPLLVQFMGFDQKTAQGTSLFMMLPPVGLFAALEYHKAGKADLGAAIVLALLFMAGAWLGAKFTVGLDMAILRKVFAVFLVLIAVKIFFS